MKVAIGTPVFLIMVSALFYGALSQRPTWFPPLSSRTIYQTVTLLGDNGKYVCRWGPNDIEIYKDSPDRFCHFKMINNDDGTISLLADNGLLLSRMGPYNIEATKNCIDPYTRFVKEYVETRSRFGNTYKIALKADTGLYLSRWGPTGLQARKTSRDKYCEFTVVEHTSLHYLYC